MVMPSTPVNRYKILSLSPEKAMNDALCPAHKINDERDDQQSSEADVHGNSPMDCLNKHLGISR
jgi:hypothetical protein